MAAFSFRAREGSDVKVLEVWVFQRRWLKRCNCEELQQFSWCRIHWQ
jgi:hypothetical protein